MSLLIDIQDIVEEIKRFVNTFKMKEKRNSFRHIALILRNFVELGTHE